VGTVNYGAYGWEAGQSYESYTLYSYIAIATQNCGDYMELQVVEL
jgi:hypothetical protein